MAIKSNLDKKLKANTQQRHQTRREQTERERKREGQSKYLYLGSALGFIGYFHESIYFNIYFFVAIR